MRGRPRHKREDIMVDLQEVRWGMDWIDLARDRNRRALVNAVMNLWVP